MHFDTAVGKAEESALLESRLLYPKRILQCLQFFYKMTGSPKDRLTIWVKMDDGTGTVRKLRKVHTIWGNYPAHQTVNTFFPIMDQHISFSLFLP